MLTLTIKLDELDDVIFDLYSASDVVVNPETAKQIYGARTLLDLEWYIENCIDADGNLRPLTLALVSPANHYVGKLVVEETDDGAAAWIVYDSQGTRRGEPCETSEDERNIPDILRAQLVAEEWEPYDE